MSNDKYEEEIQCIGLCELDEKSICIGCFRKKEKIMKLKDNVSDLKDKDGNVVIQGEF